MIRELNDENKASFVLNAIPEVTKRNLGKCDDKPSRTDFAILLNLHISISTFNCFAKISQEWPNHYFKYIKHNGLYLAAFI